VRGWWRRWVVATMATGGVRRAWRVMLAVVLVLDVLVITRLGEELEYDAAVPTK
jgi:predicted phosphoribosyltransferase